jgi:hypothetical protein
VNRNSFAGYGGDVGWTTREAGYIPAKLDEIAQECRLSSQHPRCDRCIVLMYRADISADRAACA